MKMRRRDTIFQLEPEDRVGTVTNWQGIPFRPTRMRIVTFDNRSHVEVRTAGFSAIFKLRGDTKYRDCPTWLRSLVVNARVEI